MVRRLQLAGYQTLLTPTHQQLELADAHAVDKWFADNKPSHVLLSAGKVGGIIENQAFPADFINVNLAIQLNVLRAAHNSGVKKLILFGSSCMYPRDCPQPMAETALLSGKPEPTSLAYAISKLAGVQMCLAYNQQYGEKRFIPVIPNSAFGPNDNFDPRSGHVLSALIRRFHDAVHAGSDKLVLWGSGTPRREFLYADDVADACISLLSDDISDLELPVNIGVGRDYSIRELADKIAAVTGFKGDIECDTSKPDGAPCKLLDSSRLRTFGWSPKVDFEIGLHTTYEWYLNHLKTS